MRTKHFASLLVLAAVAACTAKYAIDPAGRGPHRARHHRPGHAERGQHQGRSRRRGDAIFPPGRQRGPGRARHRARDCRAVLADLGKTAFDREAALALGEKQKIDVFFTGEVQVTKVKPQVDVLAPLTGSLFARATVDMTIKVRLVSCKNGATLWTDPPPGRARSARSAWTAVFPCSPPGTRTKPWTSCSGRSPTS